jgi:acyl carrier protein
MSDAPVFPAVAVRPAIEALARKELRVEEGTPLPGDAELAAHLDSIKLLSLVVAIEDHFEIAFEPEDDQSARTLDDVVGLVTERLAQEGRLG